jgi:hypothetical protein
VRLYKIVLVCKKQPPPVNVKEKIPITIIVRINNVIGEVMP